LFNGSLCIFILSFVPHAKILHLNVSKFPFRVL
jgi:hypothetical protein